MNLVRSIGPLSAVSPQRPAISPFASRYEVRHPGAQPTTTADNVAIPCTRSSKSYSRHLPKQAANHREAGADPPGVPRLRACQVPT